MSDCPLCNGREKIQRCMDIIEEIPELGADIYDDYISDAYNSLDEAYGSWMCYCPEYLGLEEETNGD